MKTLFIESLKKTELDINSIDFKILPKRIFIAYSIQYKALATALKKKLKQISKEAVGFKQVLAAVL